MYRIQKDNTNTNSTSTPYGKSSGVDQLKEQLVNYIYKVIYIFIIPKLSEKRNHTQGLKKSI